MKETRFNHRVDLQTSNWTPRFLTVDLQKEAKFSKSETTQSSQTKFQFQAVKDN